MNGSDIKNIVGDTDIYLIDQILKGRFKTGDIILDAGCGGGRNLSWFLHNQFEVYGVDTNVETINELTRKTLPNVTSHFMVSAVEKMPFADQAFDVIISSAVLHFANNIAHFFSMINEIIRVLKEDGILFIRMASDIGIEKKVVALGDGIYNIPDGSTRFLLTRSILQELLQTLPVKMIEDFKTVNVNDVRCMSTLVMQKTKH
jgi:ubiquinone/menaquinone biosynthesis C-methylase UbiE